MLDELILIPCSCKKDFTLESENSIHDGKSFKDDLDDKYRGKLDKLQKKVAKSFNINLEEEKIPACKIYQGKLYSQLESELWADLQENENKDVCIVNPLYGFIYWHEPIIDHDITMEDKIGSNRLNTWWKHKSISDILTNYIIKNDFDLIRSLLPVSHKKSMPFIQYNLNVDWLQYDYPKLRSGSNYYRGWDLARIIREYDMICPECESRKTKRISKEYFGCIKCGTIYEVKNNKG